MTRPAKSPKHRTSEQAHWSAPDTTRLPDSLGSQADLIALQDAAGNRAVSRLLQPSTHSSPSSSSTVPPIVNEVLRSSGQPLDLATRAFMESRFGHDFSQVQVHTDGRAAESAEAVDARAYTVGSNIVFGAGQYQPETLSGRRLLAHELVHAIQQSRAGGQRQDDISEQNDAFEAEAHHAAVSVDSGPSIRVMQTGIPPVVQRQTNQDQDPIVKAVDYIRGYVQRHWSENLPDQAMSLHGLVVARKLRWDMHLNEAQIQEVFSRLRDESRDLLNAALFRGRTIDYLLQMDIAGLHEYRATGEGFLSGLIRGEQESLLTDAPAQRNFSSTENLVASVGFGIGTLQGIGDAIISNITGVVDLLKPSYWKEMYKLLTEVIPQIIIDDEFRYEIGQELGRLSADETRKLARASDFEYGRTIGQIFGSALVEIILSFVGLGALLKSTKTTPQLARISEKLSEVAKRISGEAMKHQSVREIRHAIGKAKMQRIPPIEELGKKIVDEPPVHKLSYIPPTRRQEAALSMNSRNTAQPRGRPRPPQGYEDVLEQPEMKVTPTPGGKRQPEAIELPEIDEPFILEKPFLRRSKIVKNQKPTGSSQRNSQDKHVKQQRARERRRHKALQSKGIVPTSHPPIGRKPARAVTREETLYGINFEKRLGIKTPSNKIQKWAQQQLPRDSIDPAFPSRRTNEAGVADHIVPVDTIRQMPGFAQLTKARQARILNWRENFIASSREANSSRQSKSFEKWEKHDQLGVVDESFRKYMIERERSLKLVIQNKINEALAEQYETAGNGFRYKE